MRNFILSAIAGTALLGTTAVAPARAAVSADINIHVGRRAPAVYFQREPRVILIPDTEVYYVDDLDYDMYRSDGWWYIDDGGYWYRARSYRGPWVSLSISSLPRRVLNVPIAYRHQPYRSPNWNRGYNDGNRGYRSRGSGDRSRSGGSWSGDRRRQDGGTWSGDRSRQDDGRNSDTRWRDGRSNDQNRGANNGRGNGNGNGNGRGKNHGKHRGQGNG